MTNGAWLSHAGSFLESLMIACSHVPQSPQAQGKPPVLSSKGRASLESGTHPSDSCLRGCRRPGLKQATLVCISPQDKSNLRDVEGTQPNYLKQHSPTHAWEPNAFRDPGKADRSGGPEGEHSRHWVCSKIVKAVAEIPFTDPTQLN